MEANILALRISRAISKGIFAGELLFLQKY